MKLVKSLMVGGVRVGLVRELVWMDLSCPGRADFTVRSEKPLSGFVQMFIGDAGREKATEFFSGYVVKSHTVDRAQQRIFCRELAAILRRIIPVSIRNASLRDILHVYARKTGLEFLVPDEPYAQRRHHCFQEVGSGIHGLDSLGEIFDIPDFVWQQQRGGKIFVGAWEDSRWAQMPFSVPESFFQDVELDGTKTIQAIPGLRPGVRFNDQYLTSLQLDGHYMRIKCENQLNV